MFTWDWKKKLIVWGFIFVVSIAAGCFAVLYQTPERTNEIYKAALEDFNKGEYQNSYYLFSKISFISNLKPVAIFHRAECAKMLGDDEAELRQYEFLFNTYPKHKLSIKARYLAAQKIMKDNPQVAQKYFEYITQIAPNTDYAIASEYYLGVILRDKYQNASAEVKNDIVNYFRQYIKQAPSGRLAINAVNNWLEITDNISQDDYFLMANSCYLLGEYEKAKELLSKTDSPQSWIVDVKNSYALKDYGRVKSLAERGLSEYSSNADEGEIIDVIDIYSSIYGSGNLSAFVTGKGRDYLMYLKCQRTSDKIACYNDLYSKYPNGRFSANALSNIFFSKIKSGDIQTAKKLGKEHLSKFSNTNSAPMVMFWLGKLAERTNDYVEYSNYYRSTIENFPDTYYAYRAYLRLKRMTGPLITSYLNPQPVVYPYNYTKENIIVKLVNLGDYDIINEFAGDDEFIKSWLLYQKGDYSHSMMKARDAMEKIKDKPDKFDLRWRLVYPILFYDEVQKYAGETGNSLPLMLGLIREESYFDPMAKSVVGASGLMQIMPATANEINSKFSLGMNISDALFNPVENIKLGNYYYEFLRKNLEGYDISSVAAYNGGIGSLKNWRTSINYNDTDEFVEQIPYPETKNYVKKVFRSYWNYVRVYSGNS